MPNKPTISYKFYNVEEEKKVKIMELVEKLSTAKAHTYLQKIYANKDDAKIRIDYKIQQNKKKKYEAWFNFFYDGNLFPYSNTVGFKYVEDLVNHAFKRFNEHLSKGK